MRKENKLGTENLEIIEPTSHKAMQRNTTAKYSKNLIDIPLLSGEAAYK